MDRTELPYDFSSAVELLQLCKTNLRVAELMLANEKSWRSEDDPQWPDETLARHASVRGTGPQHEGILPGGLNVRRRAAKLHRSLQELKPNVIGST
jgi:L-serine dehydratase